METYEIKRLGHQGDGIADGPVFAPLTLPGEVVTGQLNGQRLSDIRVQTPSGDRVAASCRHFKSCGGCQLQHASDKFVSEWKVDVVRQALNAHGLETDFRPIITSPVQSRRRANLAARRTKKGGMSGFHARASKVIIEIPDCQLLHPDLLAGVPLAEKLAVIGSSRKAELSVSITLSDAGLDVSVEGGKPLDGPLRIGLAAWTEKNGVARLSWDGEVVAMREPPGQLFGSARVVPPPGAFLQATPEGEAALVAAVQDAVGECARIADLFSGCGTFALPLAKEAEVLAVEGDPDMVEALDQGWRMAQGLKKVTHESRDLFRRPLYPDELAKFDGVVLDPPRAGAEAQIEQLAQAKIPTIAYVSCNPASFAGDAATLVSAGYALKWVQVVDQFRWSSHVELVAAFTLSHITAK
ncbi:MAG: class I SAM-dependent RNA methyltransferase [Paracoccaceae bacterium]